MLTVLECIGKDHDLNLVVMAAIVCTVAAVTALRFFRFSKAARGWARAGWGALIGVVAGSGVWATHFIAMLAYSTDLPIGFQVDMTALSLVVAAVGMGLGFGLTSSAQRNSTLALGGALVGVSIVAMHFIGITAIRAMFDIEWRWGYVAAAVAWSVAGSIATVFAARRISGWRGWAASSALFVLSIVGLHFTAMTAIVIVPDLSHPPVREFMGRNGLAGLVGGIAGLIILCAGILGALESYSKKRSLRNLDLAFQGVPSGLALFGPDGRLVMWNEAYEKLVADILMKPFVGATRYDLFRQAAPALAVDVDPMDHDVWAHRKSVERHAGLIQEWPTPSGHWLRTELSSLADGSTITVLSDVTVQKAATVAMAEARDKAEAASRAKSDFLTNMSHEIRTPLNGVLGMAQVIEADELSPVQRERVRVVRESGQALLAILNDLLDLSKVQAGKLELDIGEVDIGELARTVTAAFDGAAAARDLSLTVNVADDAAGLWLGDPLRLRQVLSNLVGNALKFTHEGNVSLSVAVQDDGLVFRVSDTGIGIKPEHLDHLFDAFTQADATTTRRYGGTGLGLSISGDLVALMGGRITVTSEVGKGSCFTVTVPTTYAGPAVEADSAATAPQDRTQDRPLRILAAEDNVTNQLVLRSLLAPTGCELVIVGDGRQAVEAAGHEDFDAILMDIQMPEMNGVEATLAIRAAERTAGRNPTPIIALSANVMSHQIREYEEAGMNHWVAKPIEVDKLYAGLDLVLSAAEAGEAEETAAA